MKEVIATFSGQHDLVQKIRGGIQDFVESEVDGLKTTTADAQKALVTQTIIFIMATILMMAIMAFVLAWPIRQLNKSVERLGNCTTFFVMNYNTVISRHLCWSAGHLTSKQ